MRWYLNMTNKNQGRVFQSLLYVVNVIKILICKCPTRNRIGSSLKFNSSRVIKVFCEGGGVDSGGHEDDTKGGIGTDQVAHKNHHKVRVDVTLVDLVDDDMRDSTDARLHFATESANSTEEDRTVGPGQNRLKAHRVAHRDAHCLTAFARHPLCQRNGTDATRLCD